MSPMEATPKARMIMMIQVRRTRTLILTKSKEIFYASGGVSKVKRCWVFQHAHTPGYCYPQLFTVPYRMPAFSVCIKAFVPHKQFLLASVDLRAGFALTSKPCSQPCRDTRFR